MTPSFGLSPPLSGPTGSPNGHRLAAAYCLPGRHRRIVITNATLDALDGTQLDAVLAHEHAHLTGHHHLVVGGADARRRAFPRVPLFRHAHAEISRLVELAAYCTRPALLPSPSASPEPSWPPL